MGKTLTPTFTRRAMRACFYLGFLVTSLGLLTGLAHAAGCDGAGNCYVRAGATGSATGSDWTNAYTALPANLTRGVTYYVAAGSYPGHMFADPDSGSTYITVQAATAAAHGTSTGWSSSYAGQAVFKTSDGSGIGDIFTFQSDYYLINGVYRSTATGLPQSDWTNESSYGFKLDNSGKVACNADISLGDNTNTVPLPVHHITIQYVDVNGSHETSSTGCRENGFAGMWGSHDYTLQNNYIHNTGLTILFLRGEHASCSGSSGNVTCGGPGNGYGNGSNILVQENYFYDNFSDPSQHAEGCSCSEGLQNLTIAKNYWQDINGTGIIATASGADWNSGNGGNGPWYIYGNVAFETSCSVFSGTKNAGVVGFFYKWDTTFIQPIYILDNTVYNYPASCNSGSGILLNDGTYAAPATAVYVENNLWASAAQTHIDNSCPSSGGYASCTSVNWGYNAYFASPDNSGANDTDPNAEVSSSLAPFVNSSGYNFLLSSNTNTGNSTSTLVSANGTDLLGVSRGSNGTWDRGALQIGSTATLKSIAVTAGTTSIPVNGTTQLTATGTYSDGSTQNLTSSVSWTSSSASIVSVSNAGVATGVAAGTATITATSNSVTASISITVTQPVLQTVTVTPSNSSLTVGQTLQYAATGTYNNGQTQNLTGSVTWSSASTGVATISSSGLATASATGTTTIQAVYGSVTGSTSLTVGSVATLQSLTITPATMSLIPGATQQLTATALYSNGTSQTVTGSVTWSSSNTAYATVSSSGLVSAVAAGSATIKGVYSSVSSTAAVTVSTSTLPAPRAWWKFNEGTGWSAYDSSGNGYTSTLYGGATWAAGDGGSYAVYSAGKTGYTQSKSVNLSTTQAVTWTAWIKRTYGNGSGVLIENSSNFNLTSTGFGFFPDDSPDCGISNTIMTGVHGDVGFSLNCYAQPSSGVWHHFAAVYDKTQPGSNVVSLYIDGVLQKPVRQLWTATNTNGFAWNNMYLFSRGGKTNFTSGNIEDLRIFGSALSATQIQQIFKSGPQ